jgi:hypothetical protein
MMVLVSLPSSWSLPVFLPSEASLPNRFLGLVEYQKCDFSAFCHNLNHQKEDFYHPNQGDESPYRVSFERQFFVDHPKAAKSLVNRGVVRPEKYLLQAGDFFALRTANEPSGRILAGSGV